MAEPTSEPSRSFNSFAVLPAAGRSRRMGQPKLLLPITGVPLLRHVINTWKRSAVSKIVVTVHSDDAATLGNLCHREGVDFIVPDPPPTEMRASVVAALQFIRQKYSPLTDDAWLLAPADMPRLSTEVIDQLLCLHTVRPKPILKPSFQGRGGHPILLPWSTADDALRLPSGTGINALMQHYPVDMIETGDPGVLVDIDTPADYQRYGKSSDASYQ